MITLIELERETLEKQLKVLEDKEGKLSAAYYKKVGKIWMQQRLVEIKLNLLDLLED